MNMKRYCAVFIMGTHLPVAVVALLLLIVAIIATPILSFIPIWNKGNDEGQLESLILLGLGMLVVIAATAIFMFALDACKIGIGLWRDARAPQSS